MKNNLQFCENQDNENSKWSSRGIATGGESSRIVWVPVSCGTGRGPKGVKCLRVQKSLFLVVRNIFFCKREENHVTVSNEQNCEPVTHAVPHRSPHAQTGWHHRSRRGRDPTETLRTPSQLYKPTISAIV